MKRFASRTSGVLFGLLFLAGLPGCNEGAQFTQGDGGILEKEPLPDREEPVQDPVASSSDQDPMPSVTPEMPPLDPSPSPQPTPVPAEYLDLTFSAGQRVESRSDFHTRYGTVSEDLTLHEGSSTTETVTQVTRPVVTLSQRQGFTGTRIRETFPLANAGILDLIVVVDNSGSMREEQANLSTRLSDLISKVENTNWQIGVVTTDSGCLRTLISRDDYLADPVGTRAAFESAVKVGTQGDDVERGILHAVQGLKGVCGSETYSWVREGGTQAALIVTDEDNCGSEWRRACRNQPWESWTYFRDNTPAGTRAYGIFWDPDQACPGAMGKGWEYEALVQGTGGRSGSICDASYSPTLSAISADVLSTLKRQFVLKGVPDLDTATVTLDGTPLAKSKYRISGSMLELLFNPGMSSVAIGIEYVVGGSARFEDISLATAPVESTLSVKFDTTEVSREGFVWDRGLGKIRFNPPPPDGALVRVQYRQDIPFITEWASKAPVIARTVAVSVEGVPMPGARVSESGLLVTFDPIPLDGQVVTIRYKTQADLVRTYRVSPQGLQSGIEPRGIEIQDVVSGAYVSHEGFEDNQLTLPAHEVWEGRRIRVVQDFGPADEWRAFVLPYEPIEGSVRLMFNGVEDLCKDGWRVEGSKIIVDCRDETLVTVSAVYEYLGAPLRTFDLGKVWDATKDTAYVWVDGVLSTRFKVDASSAQITVSDPALTGTSSVRVLVVSLP